MDDSLEVIREPLERIPSCLVREQTQLDSLQARMRAPGSTPRISAAHFRVVDIKQATGATFGKGHF